MIEHSHCTLLVWTSENDFSDIVGAFNLNPSKVILKGSPISSRKPHGALHLSTRLDFKSTLPSVEAVTDHIDQIVSLFEQRQENIQQIQNKIERWILSVFISLCEGQGGFTLPPSLMGRIALLNIELSFDIY